MRWTGITRRSSEAAQVHVTAATVIRAQLNQSFGHDINAVNILLANDPSWFEILRKGSELFENLLPDDRGRFSFLQLSVCRVVESLYLNHRKGLVDVEVWDAQRGSLVALARSPGWRAWWRINDFPFVPEFKVLVDALVQEAESSPQEDLLLRLYGHGRPLKSDAS